MKLLGFFSALVKGVKPDEPLTAEKLAEMDAEAKALVAEKDNLAKENLVLSAKAKSLENEKQIFVSQISELEKAKAELEAKNADLEKAKTDLETELAKLKKMPTKTEIPKAKIEEGDYVAGLNPANQEITNILNSYASKLD